jgi:tRNA 2-thiouridine synthesizing protein A
MSEKDSRGAADSRSDSQVRGNAEVLDLRGLKCPLPALFAKRRLARAEPGEAIVVLTDDPLAPVDIPHMCMQEGYEHLSTAAEGPMARIAVRRAA